MVGATTAQRIVERKLADVVLVDVIEGIPQGKSLDMWEAAPIEGYDFHVTGSNTYDETEDSDIVVITAGLARKPGMTRRDLLEKNIGIVKGVTEQVAPRSPRAVVIVVTNPMDLMAYAVWAVGGFPKQRVIGMGGGLDSARYRSFIALELNVSVDNIHAMVLGGHGDQMVPLPRYTTVAGIPITEFLAPDQIQRLVDRTRMGGVEIVNYLKTGSAWVAPSAAIVEIVESVLLDQKKIIPCAAYLDNQYGVRGFFVGVPAKIGQGGVEQVVEIRLTDEEREELHKSVDRVGSGVDEIKAILSGS
jgi:malate dehydrogenase